MTSWWIGKPQIGFAQLANTHKFSVKHTDITKHSPMKGKTMPKRRRGLPKASCYAVHKESIKRYQQTLISQGLCESGCGNKTLINPKTRKNYRRCSICTLKRAKYNKGRKRRSKVA